MGARRRDAAATLRRRPRRIVTALLETWPYLFLAAVVAVLAWLVDVLRTSARGLTAEAAEGETTRADSIKRRRARRLTRAAGLVFWALTVILVVFAGLRVDVGTDFPLYATLLEQLDPAQPWLPQIRAAAQDPGFVLLALTSLSVSDSVQLLFFASSVITVVVSMLALRRSAWFAASAVLYVLLAGYLFPLNLVRQGIAVALNFYSWRFLDSRRHLFVLLNAVATLFHLSAAAAALLQYLIRNVRPTRYHYAALAAVGVAAVALVVAPIDGLLEALGGRYAEYVLAARANLADIGVGTIAGILLRVVVLVYTARAVPVAPGLSRLQTFASVTVPFLMVGVLVAPVARMELYFLPAFFLLIPGALRALRAGRWVVAIGFVAATGYFVATLVTFYGLLPYDWGVAP